MLPKSLDAHDVHLTSRCCFVSGSRYYSFFAMACYADWSAFRAAVSSADLLNRTQFSDIVKYSRVRDPGGLPDTLATRAVLAAQALHLVPPERVCPSCQTPYQLRFKSSRYRWIGARYETQGCLECLDQQPEAIPFEREATHVDA